MKIGPWKAIIALSLCISDIAPTLADDVKAEKIQKVPPSLIEVTNDDWINYEREKSYVNAARVCEWIGVCQYRTFKNKHGINFHNPPTANFLVVKRLKGPTLSKELAVSYQFYDSHPVKTPVDWKFGLDKMPERNSKWILFIPNAIPIPGKGYSTYYGNYGRLEATEENIALVLSFLKTNFPSGIPGPQNSLIP